MPVRKFFFLPHNNCFCTSKLLLYACTGLRRMRFFSMRKRMFARCVARKSIRVVVADCLIGCKVSWTSGASRRSKRGSFGFILRVVPNSELLVQVNVGREFRLINDMSCTTRPSKWVSISSWWKYTRFQVWREIWLWERTGGSIFRGESFFLLIKCMTHTMFFEVNDFGKLGTNTKC